MSTSQVLEKYKQKVSSKRNNAKKLSSKTSKTWERHYHQ